MHEFAFLDFPDNLMDGVVIISQNQFRNTDLYGIIFLKFGFFSYSLFIPINISAIFTFGTLIGCSRILDIKTQTFIAFNRY